MTLVWGSKEQILIEWSLRMKDFNDFTDSDRNSDDSNRLTSQPSYLGRLPVQAASHGTGISNGSQTSRDVATRLWSGRRFRTRSTTTPVLCRKVASRAVIGVSRGPNYRLLAKVNGFIFDLETGHLAKSTRGNRVLVAALFGQRTLRT